MKTDGRWCTRSMPQDVGEALLDDSIRGEIHPWRKCDGVTVDLQSDGHAGLLHVSRELAEKVETGLRGKVVAVAVSPEHAEQPAHLGHGVACGGFHRGQVVDLVLMLVGAQSAPYGPRLDDHRADAVRHHVMELSGDAGTLPFDGLPFPLDRLGPEVLRDAAEMVDARIAPAEDVADGPRASVDQGCELEIREGAARRAVVGPPVTHRQAGPPPGGLPSHMSPNGECSEDAGEYAWP